MRDEGRSLGIGRWGQIPNHLKLPGSRALVVSVDGKCEAETSSGMMYGDERKRTADDLSKFVFRRCQNRERSHSRSDLALEQIAPMVNPALRAWINYYGEYFRSALIPVMNHFDVILSRWAMRKRKRLGHTQRNAMRWVNRIARRQPELFAHWAMLRENGRMTGAV
jgi:Group II intron, maturase-specific domain